MAADSMQLFQYCARWCLTSHNELLVGANGHYYKKLSKVPLTTALYDIYITNVWEIGHTGADWKYFEWLCVMNSILRLLFAVWLHKQCSFIYSKLQCNRSSIRYFFPYYSEQSDISLKDFRFWPTFWTFLIRSITCILKIDRVNIQIIPTLMNQHHDFSAMLRAFRCLTLPVKICLICLSAESYLNPPIQWPLHMAWNANGLNYGCVFHYLFGHYRKCKWFHLHMWEPFRTPVLCPVCPLLVSKQHLGFADNFKYIPPN